MAAGDVTTESAVIWSRTDQPAYMHVLVEGSRNDSGAHAVVRVHADGDYTGKVRVTGLKAGRDYGYKVWFSTSKTGRPGMNGGAEGHFRTPPASKEPEAVVFGWGGDLAGQNVCRDAVEGFPIFKAINATPMDFFIGLGDMIYADGVCNPTGLYGNAQVSGQFLQAANMADYWRHWRYNREDEGYRSLLASMPYYAIWDDHEVVNDFGPLHDTPPRPTPPAYT